MHKELCATHCFSKYDRQDSKRRSEASGKPAADIFGLVNSLTLSGGQKAIFLLIKLEMN